MAKQKTHSDRKDTLRTLLSLALKAVFISLVFIVGILIFNLAFGTDYDAQQKPFWTGTQRMQVCKYPYDKTDDCYFLQVELVDQTTAKINFKDEGYKITSNLTCYYSAKVYDEKRYIFCRSWDSDEQQWDFMPVDVEFNFDNYFR